MGEVVEAKHRTGGWHNCTIVRFGVGEEILLVNLRLCAHARPCVCAHVSEGDDLAYICTDSSHAHVYPVLCLIIVL